MLADSDERTLRMQMIPRNPRNGIYPATDDYVHAMEVSGAARFLFVSALWGLIPKGRLQTAWKNSYR